MTKLALHRCDRCGKDFKLPQPRTPALITRYDRGEIGKDREPSDIELCLECEMSFPYWMEYHKAIDKFIDDKLVDD